MQEYIVSSKKEIEENLNAVEGEESEEKKCEDNFINRGTSGS